MVMSSGETGRQIRETFASQKYVSTNEYVTHISILKRSEAKHCQGLGCLSVKYSLRKTEWK